MACVACGMCTESNVVSIPWHTAMEYGETLRRHIFQSAISFVEWFYKSVSSFHDSNPSYYRSSCIAVRWFQ